jgi:hypothetical protein
MFGNRWPFAVEQLGTPVFNYAGTVNGSTTTVPILAALSNTTPLSVQRRTR